MYRILSMLLFISLGTGCERLPDEVYVPGNIQTTEVNISVSNNTTTVGKAITLHASRIRSGEWKLVKRRDLSDTDCWMVKPPPEYETEVADNLTWSVSPEESAVFNIQARNDHTRTVKFATPGIYRINAISHVICGDPVNARPGNLEIVVKSSD